MSKRNIIEESSLLYFHKDPEFAVFWSICEKGNNYCLTSPQTFIFYDKLEGGLWWFAYPIGFALQCFLWFLCIAAFIAPFKMATSEHLGERGAGFMFLAGASNLTSHMLFQFFPLLPLIQFLLPDVIVSFVIGFFRTITSASFYWGLF